MDVKTYFLVNTDDIIYSNCLLFPNFVTPHFASADIFSNTKQTILFDLTFVIIHHMRRKYKQHLGGKNMSNYNYTLKN